MLDDVAREGDSRVAACDESVPFSRLETSASLSRCALARTRDVRCCFACGGVLSVRTGDFQRCTSCRAENYCPLSDEPTEERARRWFHRRGSLR